MSKRIIFVDARVNNYEDLIPLLPADSEVVVLYPNQLGLVQINDALEGKTDIDAIDIISEGVQGGIYLGSGTLDSAKLLQNQALVKQIGLHLSVDGDILLYGSNVANDAVGLAFINQFAQLTGADIAASTNETGNFIGDWILEAQTNLIETQTLTLVHSSLNPLFNFISTENNNADYPNGTLDDDIIYTFGGDDIITAGSGGNDWYLGDDGFDILSYTELWGNGFNALLLPSPVYIDLSDADGSGFGTAHLLNIPEHVDRFENIELFYGSELNDILIGDWGANMLAGGRGDDVLKGNGSENGPDKLYGDIFPPSDVSGITRFAFFGELAIRPSGNDIFLVGDSTDGGNWIYGGPGIDTADYTDSAKGLSANLLDNSQNFGGALNDLFFDIENLRGSNFNDMLIGDANANTLEGMNGNDELNGGLGVDTLIGSLGHDFYVLDDVEYTAGFFRFDTVIEKADEGIDDVLVNSGNGFLSGYILPSHIENGTISGTSNFSLTGNELDNLLIGNSAANTLTGLSGNDTLNGRLGADKLVGGLGYDTYILDSVTITGSGLVQARGFDTVIENINEGIDRIEVNSDNGILYNYTLPENVENGVVYGTSSFTLNGNALNNLLIGNAANNTLKGFDGGDTLSGKAGRDKLIGGLGDDIYVLEDAFITGSGLFQAKQFDDVTEKAGEGIDGVQVNSNNGLLNNYMLPNNIDWGEITGTANFDLTGNASGNLLRGNEAANRLSGNGNARGNDADVLEGNGGNDWLVASHNGQDELNGGAGADQFIFSAIDTLSNGLISELDKITDFSLAGEVDNINVYDIDAKTSVAGNNSFTFIGSAPFTAEGQISAAQVGADTVLSLNTSGTADAEMQILLLGVDAASLNLEHFIL